MRLREGLWAAGGRLMARICRTVGRGCVAAGVQGQVERVDAVLVRKVAATLCRQALVCSSQDALR